MHEASPYRIPTYSAEGSYSLGCKSDYYDTIFNITIIVIITTNTITIISIITTITIIITSTIFIINIIVTRLITVLETSSCFGT